MSKRIDVRRIIAIFMCALIAAAFMPGPGGISKVKAAGWYADEGERIYLGVNETTAVLEANVIVDSGKYTFKYKWKKYDEDKGEYVDIAETSSAVYNVTGINEEEQEWLCEITDQNSEKDTQRFVIEQSSGWREDHIESYYVNKGESPVLKAKCQFDEGCNAASLGLSYKWSKWNSLTSNYDAVPGTAETLKIPAVNENCEYRCEIKDFRGNRTVIYFGVTVSPAKAPLFKVAYLINELKPKYQLTLADKAAVMAAKAAYDRLTAGQKRRFAGLYGNWYTDTLKDAVAMIEKLQSETDLATEKYNSAVRAAKAKAVTKLKIKVLKGRKARISWKAVKGAAGYQVVYGTKKNFKKARKIIVKKGTVKKVNIKKLKAGKKYYVKVRPVIKVRNTNGKMVSINGSWSPAGKFKAKK